MFKLIPVEKLDVLTVDDNEDAISMTIDRLADDIEMIDDIAIESLQTHLLYDEDDSVDVVKPKLENVHQIHTKYEQEISPILAQEASKLSDRKRRSKFVNQTAVFCGQILKLEDFSLNDDVKTKQIFGNSYSWLYDALFPARLKIYRRFPGNSRYDRNDLDQVIHEAMVKSILPNFDPQKAGFYAYFNQAIWLQVNKFVTKQETIFSVSEHFYENGYGHVTPEIKDFVKNTASLQEPYITSSTDNRENSGASLEDVLEAGIRYDVPNTAENNEILVTLFDSVNSSLSNSQKQLLSAIWINGTSQIDLAMEMGCSQQTISKKINHAKKQIYNDLVQQGKIDLAKRFKYGSYRK